MHACVCVCVYACVRACVCVCVHVCVCVCVCVLRVQLLYFSYTSLSLSSILPDASVPHPSRFGSRGRRVSDLQDIPEMDEDISTSSNTDTPSSSTIPPPCNLELERQFVENDKYT